MLLSSSKYFVLLYGLPVKSIPNLYNTLFADYPQQPEPAEARLLTNDDKQDMDFEWQVCNECTLFRSPVAGKGIY
jgi:hypothetical protein